MTAIVGSGDSAPKKPRIAKDKDRPSSSAVSFTPFAPDTALPSERTYCGEDHHLRGVSEFQPFANNEEPITKAHLRRLWRMVDDLRSERVQTKEIVMMLLDCAVDLTTTQCTSEVMAYRPFIEAIADLSNHLGATGLCDGDDAW
jgi:hypothetical protein